MNVGIAPVRLVFSVDSINDVAVASNWLYLTGGPLTVVRINLDSPSHVEDIKIPKKHINTAGFIKRIFSDASGKSILVVTSRCEHFFYSEGKQEFKHLSKLRGLTTICAAFHNQSTLLIGTNAGNIVEVGIDSSANETYFKRDLKLAVQVWSSPNKEPVNSIYIHGRELMISCGSEILRWVKVSGNTGVGDPLFQRTLTGDPDVLYSNPKPIKQLVVSPDCKTVAAIVSDNLIVYRRSGGAWQDVKITANLEHLFVSNYYLLAVVSTNNTSSVFSINMFSQQLIQSTPINDDQQIKGTAVDMSKGTFWLFNQERLHEIKLNDEQAGMYKILTMQERFEEALEVAHSHAAKSYVLEKYGKYYLPKSPARGAELLGLSDTPLEIAALNVMHENPMAVPSLLKARLSHTKSKAQQIMLTSWLAQLGDYSFIGGASKWDSATVRQILREQGNLTIYLKLLIEAGDIDSAVSHHVANEDWDDALDLLRQFENSEVVYKISSILLSKAPRQTVESWIRMASLDELRLLPSLIKYSNEYRGPLKDNQALRYLLHLMKTKPSVDIAVFNATVAMLSMHGADDDMLSFLKTYATNYGDHFFALTMTLKNGQHRSAVYLYTLAGLFEDAVQVCIDIGTTEMFELAVDIANNQTTAGTQGNEELRKYLLRKIAQHAIKTKGTSAAIRFVKLLRVDDLLAQFPDFDTLSDLAPEIVKSLEITNNRLNTLNQEINETLLASEDMQRELSTFKRRSVLVEPGEACFICEFPLVTRKFVVFPCQHGFHMNCIQTKLELSKTVKDIADECILCSKDNIQQIETPLEADF